MSDEGDFDKSDMSDKSIRHSVRPRVLTEKGASYEIEKTLKASKDIARRIHKLCEEIGKLTSSDDYEKLNGAVVNLNEAHDEYERIMSKATSIGSPIPQDESQAVVLAVTTAKLDAMKVNNPSVTSRTVERNQVSEEDNSQTKSKSSNCIEDKPLGNVKDFSTEIPTNEDIATESPNNVFPERLVESMDDRLQKQLSFVNQAMETSNTIMVESELSNLECLMQVISEEKSQLSQSLADEENVFLDSWFDQAKLDVHNKKTSASKYIVQQSAHPEDAINGDLSKTMQSLSSITTVIERDTSFDNNFGNVRGSVKKDEVPETPEKIMVNNWLANQSHHKSNASTRSISRKSEARSKMSSKSDVVSDNCSKNHKLKESAKSLMLRTHKRLEMQLSLIDSSLATGDVELVRTETANLDRIFSEFSEAISSYEDFILDNEKSTHSRWLDEIDSKVFKKKQEVCLWLVNHNECMSSRKSSRSSSNKSSSKSSKSSNKSKASKSSSSSSSSGAKSAIQQKAITAGLQAEANILKETMSKAIEIEAKRKEEEIKSRIETIQVQLARSKAMENVYGSSACPDQNEEAPEKKFRHKKSDTVNESDSKKSPTPALPPTVTSYEASKQVSELSKDMVRALKAPSAEIDVFAGDPLEYHYFRSNFTEAVEKMIDDQRGRLTRLIKYTDGDAKDLIKHCVHADPLHCYDQAISLLDAEYGSSHKISYAYLQRLHEWPSVKLTDTASFKKLYRFLLKCRTFKTDSRLQELDSATTLRTVVQKLHTSYQDEWSILAEKCRRNGNEANFDDLIKFVDFHSARASDPAYSRIAMEKEKNPVKGFVGKVTTPKDTNDTTKCHLCQNDHNLENCKTYLQKDIEGRRKTVLDLKLCFKCLKPTSGKHYSRICPNRITCNVCGKYHPTSFHDYTRDAKDKSTEEIQKKSNSNEDNTNSKIAACSVQQRDTGNVISLCILPVLVSHKEHPEHEMLVYAMLDNDCTGCFCTNDVMEQLALSHQREACVTVETINGISEKQTTAVNDLIVRRPSKGDQTLQPSICLPTTFGFDGLAITKDEIPTPTNLKQWNYLQRVHDQISEFDETIPFGLMIGGNCPKALEPLEVIPSQKNGPYAFNTRLGWCVVGPLSPSRLDVKQGNVQCHKTRIMEVNSSWQTSDILTGSPSHHHFVQASEARDKFIDRKLQEMYSLEFNEINSETEGLSKEDEKFLRIMDDNVCKVDGHYQLPLPFKNDTASLPCNRKQAEKRLNSIKKKMESSEFYRNQYVNNINTLLHEGYARKCDSSSVPTEGKTWYLPHHGVYQEVKQKLRIVFDCSANYRGLSLNGELLQGPDLTNQLVGVLLRFRMDYVPIMADIEAMFYQVRIPEEQRSYLRFLWWDDGDTKNEPSEYEMCVHTFGAISSPSCANYALKKTAEDNRIRFGDRVADTILRDFYVDDMLKSINDEDSAISLLSGVQGSCNEGGFNLTKVVSSSHKLINSTDLNKRASSLKEFELCKKLPVERALGVVWFVENDSFGFRISIEDQPLTRRGILSTISSIYDPCGLGSPFLLRGRKILQEITADKDGWDDPVPEAHASSWERWRSELPRLETLSIKRCVKPDGFGAVTDCSLHCFSDASFFGYGQATYLRQIDADGNIAVALVMGKSRVSPMKSTTVPRLELTAAVLSSNIGALVKSELLIQGLRDYYWIDNMVVLGYIHNETRRFRVFVANRTRKIRDLTDKNQWKYVNTNENPGDDASRGLSFDDKEKIERWFHGPEFLRQPESAWPSQSQVDDISNIDPEVKTNVVAHSTIQTDELCLLSTIEKRVSDWHRQKLVVANMRRFIKKCRKQAVQPVMSTTELQEAEDIILRLIQQKYMKNELDSVRKGIPSKSTALNSLNPFIDESGTLRVGGRLSNSTDKSKHPVILGKKGSQRIIEWFHRNVQHQGRTSTVNELRANGFWVLSVNAQVRNVIRNCIRCRLFRGKLADQLMSDLPADRLMTEPPFTYCGVDIFGPFYTKEGRKQMKRYGVLFTCLSLRAVHIETAANIDTDSFILSLRRFIARRGPVRVIRSDNGGNFVGCENEFVKEIDKLDDAKIATFLLSDNCDWITWKKNPPVSSHMGGVWERMIKSIRNVLDSLLKEHHARLDDESLHTLLVEAENIVNSRPLTTENLTDPESQPLTPNQLLTLKTKLVMPPPGAFQKEHVYCKKRWKAVQYMANQFWERWRKEYMVLLQTRQKWHEKKRSFQVGDIVLVKEDKIPRNQWKIGMLTETFPSKDGLVRSATVCLSPCKTSLHRPITKFVLLVGVEEQV